MYEIMKRLPTNDQVNFCLAFTQCGTGIMSDSRMWKHVNTDCEKIPRILVPFLYYCAVQISSLKCNATEQFRLAMPL